MILKGTNNDRDNRHQVFFECVCWICTHKKCLGWGSHKLFFLGFSSSFMSIGYDPGLSVQSALRLPQQLELADSVTAAVSDADFISLNIPYVKGDGGTHGIIGPHVIGHFKSNAVLLNFARGELVDSQAMKEFLDSGDGRYVTDFPDDLLWDHKNALVLPHLGASTEEAEDAAVSQEKEVRNGHSCTGNHQKRTPKHFLHHMSLTPRSVLLALP